MRRRIIACFLILFLVLFQVDQSKKQAEAVIPVVAYTAAQVAIAAGCLVLAGIQFNSEDGLKVAGFNFLKNAPTEIKNTILNAVDGVVPISEALWNYIGLRATDYTAETQTGEDVFIEEAGETALANGQALYFPDSGQYGQVDITIPQIQVLKTLTLPTGFGTLRITAESQTTPYYHNHYTLIHDLDSVLTTVKQPQDSGTFNNITVNMYSDSLIKILDVNGVSCTFAEGNQLMDHIINATGNIVTINISYMSDIVINKDTDYNDDYMQVAEDLTGYEVTLPTTYNSIIGATYDDVATGQNMTDPDAAANAAAAAAVAAALAAGHSQAAADAAGRAAAAAIRAGATPQDAAAQGATAADTYDDLLADGVNTADAAAVAAEAAAVSTSVATTNTLLGTLVSFFDLTLPVNLEPLKIAGTSFTSKFPFSLPWDVYAAVAALFTETIWDGHIPISAHSSIADFDFDIDLSMFSGILNIVKAFELISFDVAMIFVTRKVLGGVT